jgi:hypothetical protein
MSAETVYLDQDRVLVTNARAVVKSVTYAMSNITSVKTVRIRPDRTIPIVFGVVAAVVIFLGMGSGTYIAVIIGVVLALMTYYIWKIGKIHYALVLNTSGGEVQVLISKERDRIKLVAEAISNAIIARG